MPKYGYIIIIIFFFVSGLIINVRFRLVYAKLFACGTYYFDSHQTQFTVIRLICKNLLSTYFGFAVMYAKSNS